MEEKIITKHWRVFLLCCLVVNAGYALLCAFFPVDSLEGISKLVAFSIISCVTAMVYQEMERMTNWESNARALDLLTQKVEALTASLGLLCDEHNSKVRTIIEQDKEIKRLQEINKELQEFHINCF